MPSSWDLSWWGVGAQVAGNRYSCTKCAVAVGARKRPASGWWVFCSLLAPFALVNFLSYELLFIVGHSFLYQLPPGCSILSTNFPGVRLNVAPFEGHFERVLVALPGSASGSGSRTKFTKEHSLRESIVWHSSNMTRPSKLRLHEH